MAARTSTLHIRVDDALAAKATETLAAIGLSMEDAVGLLFHRIVADQAFPLELKVPNAETRAAMKESRRMMEEGRQRFQTADELFASLERGE